MSCNRHANYRNDLRGVALQLSELIFKRKGGGGTDVPKPWPCCAEWLFQTRFQALSDLRFAALARGVAILNDPINGSEHRARLKCGGPTEAVGRLAVLLEHGVQELAGHLPGRCGGTRPERRVAHEQVGRAHGVPGVLQEVHRLFVRAFQGLLEHFRAFQQAKGSRTSRQRPFLQLCRAAPKA